MAISCFKIKESTANALQHNDRTQSPDYLLAEKKGDFACNRSAEEAQTLYQELRLEAFSNYTRRTGQKVQTAEDKMRWSAIILLNEDHTLEDVESVAKKLCEKFGWQEIQVAIHLDEGHVNERGVAVLNRHAHIEFFMLDKQGIFQFKKRDFGKKQMSEIQDFVAEELGMKRGQSKLKTKKEGLDHRAYKQHAQAIQKAKQETKQELAYDFREMQKKITALEISSAEKKELHAENSELRKIVKSKDTTIEDQAQRIALLERKLEELKAQKVDVRMLDMYREKYHEQQKTLKIEREETNALKAQVSTLERENVSLRSNVRELEQEKEELKQEVSKLQKIVNKVSSFFSCKTSELVDQVTSFFKAKSETPSFSSPPERSDIKTHAEHAPSSARPGEPLFRDPAQHQVEEILEEYLEKNAEKKVKL